MSAPEDGEGGSADRITVGVVADPVAAPIQVAEQLGHHLPGLLARQVDRSRAWSVAVRRDHLPPSDASHTAMMEIAGEHMRQQGWDLVVCVTDVPLRSGKKPIMADMSSEHCVVVVSLPAFGAMALRRRVRNVVAQLIADMRNPGTPDDSSEQHRRRRLPTLSRRFRRVAPEQPGIDARILASRGWARLLVGMVRANQPWRLVFGLTGPLVGAFAFSAFYLINSTVWELASAMGPWRLLAATLGSVAVMVVWLVAYHHLWEPVANRPAAERGEAILFNASTLLTLAIGVVFMYVGLFLVNLLAASVVLSPEVLGQYLTTDLGIGNYPVVTVLVTAAATVAGAIGSGFESEDSIRHAAFSYRERERRQALRDRQSQREQHEDDGQTTET